MAILLLLVPLAGAIGFRVRTGEQSLLHALVGGAVAGTCIFWLALWAFLRFLPPTLAILLAIAAVCMLAAVAWRWRPADLAPLELPRLRETLTVAAVSAAAFLSILSSSTPLVGFVETMQYHVPLVASMERGNVPPMSLHEPPHPLTYHFGQHALAAALGGLGPLPSPMALFVSNAWFGALATAYAFLFGRRIAGLFGGGAAALLFVGAGTLNWLSAARFANEQMSWFALMNPLGFPFSTGNIAIGSFAWRVHGNSMAWAICLAFLVVDLSERARRNGRFEPAFYAGAALGVLAPANETLFGAVACGSVLLFGLSALRQPGAARRLAAQTALTLTLGVALIVFSGGVLKGFLVSGSATHGGRLILAWQNLGTVASFDFGSFFPLPADRRVAILSLRFLQDVGPLPFLLLPAMVWCYRRAHREALHLGLVSIAALVLSSVVTLTRYPQNTYRMVTICVVLASVPVGAALASLPSLLVRAKAVLAARLAVGGFVLLCIASWPLLHVGITSGTRDRFPPADGGPVYNQEAVRFLRANTRFDHGILSLPFKSWSVLGSGQVTPIGSYVGDLGQEFATASTRAIAALDLSEMRKLGVRYLYVEQASASSDQRDTLKRRIDAGELREIWHSAPADRASAIFELAAAAPATPARKP